MYLIITHYNGGYLIEKRKEKKKHSNEVQILNTWKKENTIEKLDVHPYLISPLISTISWPSLAPGIINLIPLIFTYN